MEIRFKVWDYEAAEFKLLELERPFPDRNISRHDLIDLSPTDIDATAMYRVIEVRRNGEAITYYLRWIDGLKASAKGITASHANFIKLHGDNMRIGIDPGSEVLLKL